MIDFLEVKKLFPQKQWDVGFITSTQLKRCAYKPIKIVSHFFGLNFTNSIHFFGLRNCIVLIRNTPHTGDYGFYEEASDILNKSCYKKWRMIYTNFKEAALQAGLGVRAKNSLIYSYRFGFDSKICVVGFDEKITNMPTNKRVNKKLWNRCVDCWDCAVKCPVKAIHNDSNDIEDNWIDGGKCDNFISFSDHPTIPSTKKFWHKYVHPEIPKKEVNKLKTCFDVDKKYGKEDGLPWDKNGYTFHFSFGPKKDGKPINVPMCRECTSQPRCSKWNGKFPYNNLEKIKKQQAGLN
jgi:ferredoxin